MIRRIILLIFVVSSFALAQADFNFKAQIRPRWEYNNKNFSEDVSGNSFTGLRTRIGMGVSKGKNLYGFIQAQDSRIYGTESGTISNEANVDIHQAYFVVKNLFDLPLHVKMGRMEVAFGAQRLVGSVGWSNIGRSFDGFMVTFQRCDENKIQFFSFTERETMTNGDLGDMFFSGVNFTIGMIKNLNLQPYFFWQSMDPDKNLSRMTLGAYAKGTPGKLVYEAEFAYQTGTQGAVDIAAFMGTFQIGANFEGKVKPGFMVGVDYLSGDEKAGDDEYNAFNTLYATNHKFYGFMDYFINVPAATNNKGLMDIHANFDFMPFKKAKLSAKVHMFSSAEDFTLNDGSASTNFGNEVDLTFKYKYSNAVNFALGASVFMPGDIYKEAMGEDMASWLYFMTVVNL